MRRLFWLIIPFLLYHPLLIAQEGTGEIPDSPGTGYFPSVSAVLTDSFPVITLILTRKPGDWSNFHLENFRVSEDDLPAQVVAFSAGRANHSLKIGLVFDHGPDPADQDSVLPTAKDAAGAFFSAFDQDRDSFLLVSFAESVDNTDFNNNTGVFNLILNSLEPGEGRRVYDAMQVGLEALLPHDGRRILVLFASGNDDGSDTPSKTVLQTARHLRIPVYVVATGGADVAVFENITRRTGGAVIYATDAKSIPEAFMEISHQIQEVSELTYISPKADHDPPFRRSVEVITVISPDFPPQNTKITYRVDQLKNVPSENLTNESENRNFFIMAIAVVVCLVIVVGFIIWRRRNMFSDQIVPAITEMSLYRKNTRLRVSVSNPLRNRPAKFTIYTDTGSPVMDMIFPGRKRKYDLDISELPFGVYYCTLTNGGLTSEKRPLVKQVS